jgi:hypothetical protein
LFRKHRQWLALLVLPALVFRALIPVGFMPLVDADGGITIGFCPGEAALPGGTQDHQSAAHGAHQHQHHRGGNGSEDSSTSAQHHTPCLFAAGAGGAPAPAIVTLETAAPEVAQVVHDDAAEVFLPTILRAQSPRGPPAFS